MKVAVSRIGKVLHTLWLFAWIWTCRFYIQLPCDICVDLTRLHMYNKALVDSICTSHVKLLWVLSQDTGFRGAEMLKSFPGLAQFTLIGTLNVLYFYSYTFDIYKLTFKVELNWYGAQIYEALFTFSYYFYKLHCFPGPQLSLLPLMLVIRGVLNLCYV